MLGEPQDSELVIEPIVGWRYWDVSHGEFVSPQMGTGWRRGSLTWDGECGCGWGQKVSAARRVSEFTLRRVLLRQPPQVACHCGVNAFDTAERAINDSMLLEFPAVGQVELTGEVTQLEKGWRGQNARIVRVWSCDPLSDMNLRAACYLSGVQYMGPVNALVRPKTPQIVGGEPRVKERDSARVARLQVMLIICMALFAAAVWAGGWIMAAAVVLMTSLMPRLSQSALRVAKLTRASALQESAYNTNFAVRLCAWTVWPAFIARLIWS